MGLFRSHCVTGPSLLHLSSPRTFQRRPFGKPISACHRTGNHRGRRNIFGQFHPNWKQESTPSWFQLNRRLIPPAFAKSSRPLRNPGAAPAGHVVEAIFESNTRWLSSGNAADAAKSVALPSVRRHPRLRPRFGRKRSTPATLAANSGAGGRAARGRAGAKSARTQCAIDTAGLAKAASALVIALFRRAESGKADISR